jgi:hypothetical protein
MKVADAAFLADVDGMPGGGGAFFHGWAWVAGAGAQVESHQGRKQRWFIRFVFGYFG